MDDVEQTLTPEKQALVAASIEQFTALLHARLRRDFDAADEAQKRLRLVGLCVTFKPKHKERPGPASIPCRLEYMPRAVGTDGKPLEFVSLSTMADRLKVPTKWLSDAAKRGLVPHARFGNKFGFEPEAVEFAVLKRSLERGREKSDDRFHY